MRVPLRVASITTFAVMLASPARAATCEELKALTLARTSVTSAQTVAAGAFVPPGPPAASPAAYRALAAFCRVQGVIRPSADSHIEFEVWLPATGWNGKYQGVGNGGFAGFVNYENMTSALAAGYATSSTDTGHKANGPADGRWALGQPEKLTDYGYRGIHETAVVAKAIIRGFYGEAPRWSYFSSCSNGGRQALMEAQRYPEDYDGIIAGAPAANLTRIIGLFSSNVLAMTADAASHVPPVKLPAIEKSVLAACDARDGATDGIVADPPSCKVDLARLQCTGAETNECLTRPQIATLEKIYAGLRTSGGQALYPGFVPGGETGLGGWALWISGPAPDRSLQFAFSTQANAFMVFQNASYDYRSFNVDRDVKEADSRLGGTLNAINPDLRAFLKRGGKLILYHGWADAALPPNATIDYYRSVVSTMGQKDVDAFVRLYMVPGMQHCGGGPGADNFGVMPGLAPRDPDPSRNMSAALERWVEQGVAPGSLIATKYKAAASGAGDVAFTRPLCAYPQVPRYKGSGNVDEAGNFGCVAP